MTNGVYKDKYGKCASKIGDRGGKDSRDSEELAASMNVDIEL